MSYIGLLAAYGLAVIPRTLPHYKKYLMINTYQNWDKLTDTERCDAKKQMLSDEYRKKTEVYDNGDVKVFGLTGLKTANEWGDELVSEPVVSIADQWISKNC